MSIILDHVNYIYDEDTAMAHAALIDVNLEIPKGQFIGLIGHTGSGKSTLIQHMNGLVKPTSGGVYFDGKDMYVISSRCVWNKNGKPNITYTSHTRNGFVTYTYDREELKRNGCEVIEEEQFTGKTTSRPKFD